MAAASARKTCRGSSTPSSPPSSAKAAAAWALTSSTTWPAACSAVALRWPANWTGAPVSACRCRWWHPMPRRQRNSRQRRRLPVVFYSHLARTADQAELHIARLQQRAAVVDHLWIAAQHHPPLLGLQGKTGSALQLAIGQQRGDPPMQGARHRLAGDQRQGEQLAGVALQGIALLQALDQRLIGQL